MAALDIANGTKVIDAAMDYGWETPDDADYKSEIWIPVKKINK